MSQWRPGRRCGQRAFQKLADLQDAEIGIAAADDLETGRQAGSGEAGWNRKRKPAEPARIVLLAWMALVFAFLFLPIFVVVLYSFNGGRNLYVWTEFSPYWYGEALSNPRVVSALVVSLEAALINAAIAVSLGVPAGIALARRKG